MSTEPKKENRFQNWMLFGIFFVLLAGGVLYYTNRKSADQQKEMEKSINEMQRLKGSK